MKNLLFVGLDVDDNAFHATVINKRTGEYTYFKTKPSIKNLIEKLLKFHSRVEDYRICYEATYLGFSLCRKLNVEGFHCDVIAVGLIPELPGKRVKTDRCDSQNLAMLYMKDMLTVVHVPTEEDEAERDIVRSRNLVQEQIKATKNRIQSILRKTGIDYRQETGLSILWTDQYRRWLPGKLNKLKSPAIQRNIKILLANLEYLEASLKTITFEISEMAQSDKYKARVKALTAYRGIEELTAMKIITEIGDIKRFNHPRKLMSFLGFDVNEYSSGSKEKKFGITKRGNKFVRTALVEAVQKCYLPPKIGRSLQKRREGVPVKITMIADKCMHRLYKKSNHLRNREKHINKMKIACARELAGFIWNSLHQAS